MKLTKKLLAVVLAVAMVFGMVAVSATASITDYYQYDKDTNPYSAKYALKAYKVDTATGEKLGEITDGAVDAGDVVRVEIWAQTNYYTTAVSSCVMYQNNIFVPTMLDFSTYDYYARPTTVNGSKVLSIVELDEDHAGSVDGTLDAPFYANETMILNSTAYVGKTAAMNFSATKKYMPESFKGTGTAANNYATAEGLKYNYLYCFTSPDLDYTLPGAGLHIILTELQPVVYFYLTVGADAADGTSGTIAIHPETIASSTYKSAQTYISRSYTEDGSGEADAAANNLQYISTTKMQKYIDYYGDDTTQYDRVVDVSEATITLTVGGSGSVDPAPTVDKTALKAAIDTTVDTTNCTSASVKAYTDALAAAQTVYDKADATQTEVDNAKNALLAAISGLTKLGACDYAALDAAISAYDALTLSDYTPASVAASNVTALYNAAKAVERNMTADEPGTNQAKINNAATALDTAIKALVKKADKTALNAAIAQSVDTTNCTAASVKAYNDAKAAAEAVAANDNATQTEVDNAKNALLAAISGLTKLGACDYSALDAAISAYDALTLSDYTPDSVAASNVTALYNAAKAVERNMTADEPGANQAKINNAATALDTAIKALVAKADKTALNAAIAQNVDTTNCTAASVKAYNDAKAAAEAVAANDNATQTEVDNAKNALLTAISGLTKLGACDYTALDKAIAAYEALTLSNYTPASVEASNVTALYNAAKAVERNMTADEPGANQAKINNAATALDTAIKALVAKADKTALVAKIAAAKGYTADNYTPDSWVAADLENVIAAAEVVNANANASDADVASAIAAIDAAIAKLVVKADKSALKAAIDAAEALAEADYTPDSWAAADLANVIAAAKEVYDDGNASGDEVASAIASLNAATAKLVAKADKANLAKAIDTLPTVSEDCATADSWAAYTSALAAAQDVYADAGATQDAVNKAEADLLAAIAGVTAKACDYTALDKAIADYEALNIADYVDTTAATVAYNKAKAIARDLTVDEAGANQAKIDSAATALDTAIKALVAKADKTALKAAIDTEITLDENTATADSWAAYTSALAAAQDVYADAEATQDAVDAAEAALVSAIGALKARELCDYLDLDAALTLTPAEEQGKYTASSWKAYADAKAAAEKVDRNLINDKSGANQAAVDAAAQALVDAFNGLTISQAAVTEVKADFSEYYKQGAMDYEFTVTGAPSKLRVAGIKGSTITLDRYHRSVKIVSYNAAGEVIDYAVEDPAYEVWTVALSLGEGDFNVWAKYGKVWEEFRYGFTVEFADNAEDEVKFVAKEAGSNEEASKALVLAKGSTAEITVVAPDTATKVQLVFASGSTSTYTAANANVVDNGDGTCTWTITRLFKYAGTGSMALKLKDAKGWYEANTAIITTEVTK